MSRYKTFADGGDVFPEDLNAIQDDYEGAFAGYKSVLRRCTRPFGGGAAPTPVTGGNYYVGEDGSLATVPTGSGGFYLDPADFAVPGRTTRFRLRATLLTNSATPGVNITARLDAMSAPSGAAGSIAVAYQSNIQGVQWTAPGSAATNHIDSGDFALGAGGGLRMFAVGSTGSPGSGAVMIVLFDLQVRQV